jgi:electron transfer flavoprotein beta subunit
MKILVPVKRVVDYNVKIRVEGYASLPNIMKAKKKPLDETSAEALGVDITPRLEVLKTVEPATRKAGVKVASVDELIEKLKNEAGVI